MKLKFTLEAEEKFFEAIAYYRARNPQVARNFRKQAGQGLARLKKFPNSGRVPPEFPQMAYREIIVQQHRFFYRVDADNDRILIVAIWHGKQEPKPPKEISG